MIEQLPVGKVLGPGHLRAAIDHGQPVPDDALLVIEHELAEPCNGREKFSLLRWRRHGSFYKHRMNIAQMFAVARYYLLSSDSPVCLALLLEPIPCRDANYP